MLARIYSWLEGALFGKLLIGLPDELDGFLSRLCAALFSNLARDGRFQKWGIVAYDHGWLAWLGRLLPGGDRRL